MASSTPLTFRQRRSQRRGSTHGIRSMSERQLEAYLQARDTLRRIRALASFTSDIRRKPPNSASEG
jgi:hypothetical protein